MQSAHPIAKDLVLVGGGHTHAIVLRKFGMKPLPGLRLTLISNLVDTPYSGMLPCHISGLYDFDTAHIDLRPLSRFAQCQLFMDTAMGIDPVKQQVICAHHPPVRYDVLSVDVGSTPAMVKVPGAAELAIPAKPVPQLLQAWDMFLETLAQRPPAPIAIAIVGGGVGGVELTLNMQVRLWQRLEQLGRSRQDLAIHLFHRGSEIAHGRNRSTRRLLHRRLVERGIHLHLNQSVDAIQLQEDGRRRVHCESGLTVGCDRVFWVTNASAPAWIKETGLATDTAGFLLVRDTLQSDSHPNVFAAGDVATMKNHPRPKAGVFAVRQAPSLFHNLQAYLRGQPLKPFHPQKQYLNIIDTGGDQAIASRGPFTLESSLMRAWKDRIDKRFMGLFTDFPEMPPTPAPEVQLPASRELGSPTAYCAGCGSKVGRDVLTRALQRARAELSLPPSDAILVGLREPDDAAVVQVPANQLMVHTVDFFRALIADPFVFAQIVAKHCLNDLYAMGAVPQSVLAIATLPYGLPDPQTETLYHILSGLQKALSAAGAPLIGGHTTAGVELALGLACNGLVSPQQLLRKGGLQVGNKLVLTQPLGTGTLFAADMAKQAKGRWIENAVTHMLQSSAAAMDCFQQHQATACTDITGFGLLGHLLEMVSPAHVGVELDLRQLPLLWGAHTTLQQGIVSSLHPQNLQAARSLSNGGTYASHPDYPILFDPQTAGGLLAGIPGDRVEACLHQLHQRGYTASACIGSVVEVQGGEPPITIKAW